MWKIIDLDIDAALSADTGVWEVAWVEMPAIEQELIFFGRQKFYKAPESVSSIACRAIKENEERGNPAATQVGKIRGQQLCNRDEISLETIKRMKSYLERAKVYNTDNWDDNGTISWKLWGGQAGLEWVDKVLKSVENQELADDLEDACWEGYEPIGLKPGKGGRMVPNCVPIEQKFVYPNPGESKDDFISRCIPYVINEGRTPDQAAGKCYGMWEGKQDFALNKVSFDWDETLSTDRGKELLKDELRKGNIIYIISARNTTTQTMYDVAKEYNIPSGHVYATGSNNDKIAKIKELGITKHYDNNRDVISKLGKVGIQFDYIANLPAYQNTTGDTYNEDCGCMKKEDFNLVGYIDGQPVFSSKEEAEVYGKTQMGCDGSHEHTDEDGNIVFMPCEIHNPDGWAITSVGQENIQNFSIEEYSEEEKETYDLLRFLQRTDLEKFEAVVGELRGSTLEQIKRRNHKTATTYYLYKRVENGSPDRSFCTSIEGRYFRRLEIDLLNPLNKQFGHKEQAYSKWLYKGGPNCVHAWHRVLVIGNRVNDVGAEPGLPGTPPKLMANNGYFDKDTKRASEIAYIISQQNMSKEVELTGELLPFEWYNGFPLYEDQVQATDASYLLGCGGVYETVERTGGILFQACSSNMKKQEMSKTQFFAADEERRLVYMPLMIPNILIPRLDDTTGERYFVKFSPEVIEKIQQKFMIEQRLRETNLEHTDYKFQDAVMVESWIVGQDDKTYSLGFTQDQIPAGSWMAAYKILDTPQGDELWEKYIKSGKVKGGSVEGNFILNFSTQKTDEYLLEEIINIIKTIQ
jgi:hypothetical protein